MFGRGTVVAFPILDPRGDVRLLTTLGGDRAPDALVTLQGGPVTQLWGYVTCAFAWRAGGPSPAASSGLVALSPGFVASPLLLHRFPRAWLSAEAPLGVAPADQVDNLVDRFVSACADVGPSDSVRFARGTVFAGDVEALEPESQGYGGVLRVFADKAVVSLAAISAETRVFPSVTATSRPPTVGASDWVFERSISRPDGTTSTMWVLCHEVLTKDAASATLAALFRGFQRYPLTTNELADIMAKVRHALTAIR